MATYRYRYAPDRVASTNCRQQRKLPLELARFAQYVCLEWRPRRLVEGICVKTREIQV